MVRAAAKIKAHPAKQRAVDLLVPAQQAGIVRRHLAEPGLRRRNHALLEIVEHADVDQQQHLIGTRHGQCLAVTRGGSVPGDDAGNAFATLDTSSRRLRFPRDREVIITDTVGFIRDLPKDLMAAFKATLEELDDAQLLLHLVDISDPARHDQVQWVEQILIDLDLQDIPRLLVLNKADLVSEKEAREEAEALEGVYILARDRSTFKGLLDRIEQHMWR